MQIIVVISLSAVLVGAATWLHHEILLQLVRRLPSLTPHTHQRTLLVVFAAMAAHLAQICLYAGAFWLGKQRLGLGDMVGTLEGNVVDYLYYSAATFTTLGVGDITAVGPLRLLAAAESLNGLILITWSASFTYLTMQEYWDKR